MTKVRQLVGVIAGAPPNIRRTEDHFAFQREIGDKGGYHAKAQRRKSVQFHRCLASFASLRLCVMIFFVSFDFGFSLMPGQVIQG